MPHNISGMPFFIPVYARHYAHNIIRKQKANTMKKLLITAITAAGTLLPTAYAAEATELDVDKERIMIENGTWTAEGNFTGGTPSPDKDLRITNWLRILGNSTVVINNLIVSRGPSICTINGANNGEPGKISDEAKINEGTFDFSKYAAPDLIVNGSIIYEDMEAASRTVSFGSAEYRAGFGHIKVAGDIDMGNADNFRFGWNYNETYSESNYALDVGGVVKMGTNKTSKRFIVNRFGGGDSDGNYLDLRKEVYVRLGGLSGLGAVCNNDPGAAKSTIVFQNQEGKIFQGGDWSGQIRADSVLQKGMTSSEMKFIMDDTSGGGNRQIMRIRSGDNDSAQKNVTRLDFEIRNGIFGLGNEKGTKTANIILSGGTLEIYSIIADDPHGYGLICTDNMEISGGKIVFNVAKESGSIINDGIEVAGISGKNGTFVLNLDDESFALGEEINISGEDLYLFRYISDNSYDWDSSTLKVMYGGVDITKSLNAALHYTENGAYADISGVIIPESAQIAAIFGMTALLFATRRRSK